MNKKTEINRNTRVAIKNNMPWAINFHSSVSREDVVIPESDKPFKLFTVEMVEQEIMSQNIAFVGVDGMGTHAAVEILDQELYEYLFDTKEKQKPFKFENVENLIETAEVKQEYAHALEELIVTPSEAKASLFYASEIDFENYVAWKETLFNDHCKSLMK